MSSQIRGRSPCNQNSFFFFNDTATTEIYTLSLHDALPISAPARHGLEGLQVGSGGNGGHGKFLEDARSEEHTSELQSRQYLVCRLLLEKKKVNCQRLGAGLSVRPNLSTRQRTKAPAAPCYT